MQQQLILLVICNLISLSLSAQSSTKSSELHLCIKLLDRSHINGIPLQKNISFTSSLGGHVVNYKEIYRIEFKANNQRVFFSNGDILTVKLKTDLLKINSQSIGPLKIDFKNIVDLSTYRLSPSFEGLVAAYSFDGHANDDSGNGNHGTVYGSTLVADRYGRTNSAYEFDGVNDHIEVPVTAALTQSNSYTISVSAWVKSKGSSWGVIGIRPFWLLHSANQDGGDYGIRFYVGQNKWASVRSKNKVSINTWHHWVGVYNGDQLLIYLDGKLNETKKCEGKITGAVRDGNDKAIIIGKDYHPSRSKSRYSRSIIDDIQIYDRPLSSAEVKQLYKGFEK